MQGRSILVTGSSRGIGRAIADGLAAQGADPLYHGLEPRPADLPAERPYLVGDLEDVSGPDLLLKAALELRPGLDGLVCNAGSFFDAPYLEMTAEAFDRTMRLNVRASYFLIQGLVRRLAAEGRAGAVVVVASTNGLQAEEDSTAYDTSKGALVMLVRSAATSLGSLGIRVNGIAPGLIRTPLTAQGLASNPEKEAHYNRKIVLGRLGMPEDCVGPVVFLLSDASAYVTGHILVVDGGLIINQIGKIP